MAASRSREARGIRALRHNVSKVRRSVIMFSPVIRRLILAAAALGVVQLARHDRRGWLLPATAGLLGYGQFSYGTVRLGFRACVLFRLKPEATRGFIRRNA